MMERVDRKGRNSSIELLRILCLVLIFWMHASGSYQDNTVSVWLSIAINVIGNIGVSCFILISGYYGIRLDLKKLLLLDFMLIFYSWAAMALQFAWGNQLGGEEILAHLLPVIGRQSWYFTCYFALALLSPYLNETIEKLGELKLHRLLITMLAIFSGVTTFFFFDINQDGGKGIVQMVMLYMIGRYIGIYKKDVTCRTGKLVGAFSLVAGINFCLNSALYIVTGTVQNRFARDNTLFTIFQAILVLLIFRNLYFENKFINRVAKFVPAAFVMEWTLRELITRYLTDYLAYAGKNSYQLILLGIAVLMVVLGSVIEWLRNLLLHGVNDWIVNGLYGIGEKLFQKVKQS